MERLKLLLMILLIISIGCNDGSLSKATEELKQAVEQTKETIKRHSPLNDDNKEMAAKELEKLFLFEYKVIELGQKESSERIEAELGALGKDRWDCFHVEPSGSTLRVFCKRAPKTYLRYIPRMF